MRSTTRVHWRRGRCLCAWVSVGQRDAAIQLASARPLQRRLLNHTRRMSPPMKTQAATQLKHPRTFSYRTEVCRFRNTLYLGCVIGVLAGVGAGQAALALPKWAWRRVSMPARSSPSKTPSYLALSKSHA
jgi:hypothetical protein